jgi:Ca2+-binding EF-hand superfamily protein
MPTPSTLLGALTGMVLSLSVAVLVVMAGNGHNNPGMGEAQMMQSAASGASAPLPHQDPARDSFGSLDLNGDGRVSLAEAAGYGDIMTRFARADRNKDGKLTKVEFERLAKLPPPKARPKPKLRLREDAAAALASAPREERRSP